METIRPAQIPANTESTPIKSKIPEYASQFKKEWLVIRGINKTCGDFIERTNYISEGKKFNTPQANRIKYFIKKFLKAQERGRLKDISGFYFKYYDALNINFLAEELDRYFYLYVNLDGSYEFDEEYYNMNIDSDYPDLKEITELLCLLNDKIKIEKPIIRFDSVSVSVSESESESESD